MPRWEERSIELLQPGRHPENPACTKPLVSGSAGREETQRLFVKVSAYPATNWSRDLFLMFTFDGMTIVPENYESYHRVSSMEKESLKKSMLFWGKGVSYGIAGGEGNTVHLPKEIKNRNEL